jgi:hypothetical protein
VAKGELLGAIIFLSVGINKGFMKKKGVFFAELHYI